MTTNKQKRNRSEYIIRWPTINQGKGKGGSGSHSASEYRMILSHLQQRVPGEGALAKAQSGNTHERKQEASGAGAMRAKVKGERS